MPFGPTGRFRSQREPETDNLFVFAGASQARLPGQFVLGPMCAASLFAPISGYWCFIHFEFLLVLKTAQHSLFAFLVGLSPGEIRMTVDVCRSACGLREFLSQRAGDFPSLSLVML
jgi:hypothetical protein